MYFLVLEIGRIRGECRPLLRKVLKVGSPRIMTAILSICHQEEPSEIGEDGQVYYSAACDGFEMRKQKRVKKETKFQYNKGF